MSSAGIAALVGNEMDPLMAHEAALRGIDARKHRARQLTGRILKDADVVLVFGPEHVEWIANEYPEHLAKAVSLGQAARALQSRPRLASSSWRTLLDDVQALSVEPCEADEIKDPYRRGEGIAKCAAGRICADLDVLSAALSR
ncbi:Low molecular weight protein-tyrosine-phosphatase Wzb [Acidipropionibacterium virtanenii]|uniref:Low molecular weight protein-tyrosine-phosphatase Wzb n=1 Tax=Acidipropionibacterium virtanenii TaxID=2057246 RepID=A0A344UX63_9ACTN|nr:Low molecular weight protein-tyrosine-phosphatase Wzb [Acidipropionibacterium virtanenii]